MSTVTLRYGNVFGPRQDPAGEAGVIAIFAGRLLDGKQPVIFGDGEATRDYTFVGDVVAANLTAAENHNATGSYNIGTGTESSVLEVVAALRDAGGVSEAQFTAEHRDGRLGELQRSSLDVSRARDELGFTAGTPLREGTAAVLAHLQAERG